MSSLTILRTDTVFAKLPIHTLTKSVPIDICINQTNDQGVQELHWSVSPSAAYGAPQLLAYKLDTLVINRHLDALKRPLPSLICLGSLRQMCQELGLSTGKSTGNLKRAFYQNAGVFITAKLQYRDLEGNARRLEAGFNRYGVVFTGQSLPDGSTADAVYIILHESYRQVLNSAPTRPIDYDYLTDLKPLAQRFYELVSFRMYAALKYHHPQVSMPYSELCQFAPQHRHTGGKEMSKQMSRVHQPHLQSGYLAAVETERAVDPEGHPDWLLHYTPGPKAHADYQVFTGSHRKGCSSLRVAAGTDETVALLSNGSDMAALDPASAGRDIPPRPNGAGNDPRGRAQVQGDSHESCASCLHPVSSAPLTPLVTERGAVDESPIPDVESIPDGADLVQQFYREFHGVGDKAPHAREIKHAERLLADHGQEFAAFFLEFAKRAVRQEDRIVHVFGGLLRYETAALAAYRRHQAKQERIAADAAEAHEARLRKVYEQERQARLTAFRDELSSEALTALEAQVREELMATEPIPRSILGARLKAELHDRLALQAGVPSYEDWLRQREETSR